jgi:hypothetical protein
LVAALAAASNAIASDTLISGGTLTAGQTLTSADGHFELAMQSDGNLVLFVINGGGTPRAVWSTGTSGDLGDHAVLQSNGNLVLLDANGQTIWSNNEGAVGCTNLKVQDDGNLVLYTAASAYWATGTIDYTLKSGERLLPGQAIYAHGEHYELAMQTDGNLVLYGPKDALWSSGTSGHPGDYAIMRSNGDLVVVNAAGHDDFLSHTYDKGSRLDVLSDGNLVIYSGSTKVWDTGTGSSKTPTGPTRFPRPAFTACPPPPPAATPPPAPPQDPVVLVPVKSPLPKLRVKMTMNWTWNRGLTRLHKLTVSRFPRRGLLIVGCRGKGCARHATKTDWRHLGKTIRSLDGRRYRAGNRLLITVWQKGYRSELVGVQIRWGALPKVKLVR